LVGGHLAIGAIQALGDEQLRITAIHTALLTLGIGVSLLPPAAIRTTSGRAIGVAAVSGRSPLLTAADARRQVNGCATPGVGASSGDRPRPDDQG
jgi:hypothetical protein